MPVEYHSHTLPSYAKIRNSVSTLLPDKNRTKKETVQKLTQNPISSSKSNDSSLGYFRNGHYYDPGPNPEVYAPASSYSDRSTKLLSTFQSDLRRTPSISSSVSSAGGSVSSLYYNHLYSFTCEIITYSCIWSAFVLLSSKTEIFSIEPYSFLFMKNKNSKSSVVNAGSSDILFTFLFSILEWQEMMLTTRALITIHFLLIQKMPQSQWKFK